MDERKKEVESDGRKIRREGNRSLRRKIIGK
jgi:hypothetical protein